MYVYIILSYCVILTLLVMPKFRFSTRVKLVNFYSREAYATRGCSNVITGTLSLISVYNNESSSESCMHKRNFEVHLNFIVHSL